MINTTIKLQTKNPPLTTYEFYDLLKEQMLEIIQQIKNNPLQNHLPELLLGVFKINGMTDKKWL